MFLIYDTETTGLPRDFNAPPTDVDNWPRMVQIAWQLHDEKGRLIENKDFIVKPDGFDIPFNSVRIHGITTERAMEEGLPLSEVLEEFRAVLKKANLLAGHNLSFDQGVVGAEFIRCGLDYHETEKPIADTMELSTEYCKLPGGWGGGFKPPKLEELHQLLFGEKFDEAHNAAADVNATARSFMELLRLGVLRREDVEMNEEAYRQFSEINTAPFEPFDIEISETNRDLEGVGGDAVIDENKEATTDAPYFHFHNHTSFSILTATTSIEGLVRKAAEEGMLAVGMTDSGNLMGAFKFVDAVKKVNAKSETTLKSIIGCEIYVAEDYQRKKFTKDNPDRRFTQLLIAKNKNGFQNLSKISSIGYTEGYYAGYPRVGREVIEEYAQDLIAITGSLNAEVPNLILNVGEAQAEEAFRYWHELFGEDYYVELIRHGLPEEEHVNRVLLRFAEKYKVKVIAQNNTFYIHQSDADAQDILLCVRDNERKDTPIGRGRGFRFGFPNEEFYFKSQDQMRSLFHDIPEAIENLYEIYDKIEAFDLAHDVLLPKFDIPEEFKSSEDEADGGIRGEMAYLRHLAYSGAKERYGELSDEIIDRLEFELETIENTGYPGYFLIVQDITSQARKMGVKVGPGRGSAAGSAVAYCTRITNVDPIKYELLFERFLNPDRISMPDIDIDFDDRGRDKIIRWVVEKYGKNQVAQIITYGTMAGKSAIRDTARVLGLPLPDTDRIAKKAHVSLNALMTKDDKWLKGKLNSDTYQEAMELKYLAGEDTLEGETLQQARVIEGSLRNTGVHACGVIITPRDIREMVPVAVAKDSELLITQYDNSVVERAGLLKMDFLGLRTLTIMEDAVDMIYKNHGVKIDLDALPLDDKKTYELFQKGLTIGIFQYESVGMQKHMISLKPDQFDDLIAMNALYRPGPLQYIPNFIKRKQGLEEIVYDLPEMEEVLAETYGITVYQEQVMRLSRKLAGFTRGEADGLRKVMGKKLEEELKIFKPKFIEGGKANGHPEKILEKIWTDWVAFANYAFNKSHSTCYALIGYQTGYLKAHYPAEFMASVLSNNMNNIKEVTLNMEECRSLGIPVLRPDVNESAFSFWVNDAGDIRFGMGAVKGVGSSAVDAIISEREENGRFSSIIDFMKRVDLHQVNKRSLESLILAGAFDDFEMHRAQFFVETDGSTNLEKLVRFGQSYQDSLNSMQTSLFGETDEGFQVVSPNLPDCPLWNTIQRLNREKEVVGLYLSSHPLDDYADELNFIKAVPLRNWKNKEKEWANREFPVAGIITEVQHRVSSRDGRPFGIFTLEDYEEQYEFKIFGEDYIRLQHFLQPNITVAMRVKVTERIYKNEKGEVAASRIYTNIMKMELLSEVLIKHSKRIVISFDLSDFTKPIYESIIEILESNRGEKDLHFEIEDTESSSKVDLGSPNLKIEIHRGLIRDLKKIPNLNFRLN